MRDRRIDSVKVLVFAGTTAVALGILLFLLFGRRIWTEGRAYRAVFRGVSVSGLEEGSAVEYLGVPAGRVEQIRFQEGGFPNIVVTMRLREDIPIQTGTRARLSFHPLTGLGRVVLEGGEAEAQELPPGGEIETIPSFFDQLSQTLPGVLAKVPEILEEMGHASRAIEDTLDEPMRRRLSRGAEAFAEAADDLRSTSEQAREDLRAARVAILSLSDRIGSEVESAATALRGAAGEAEGAARAARELFGGEDLRLAAERVRALSEGAEETLETLRDRLERGRRTFDETLVSVRDSARAASALFGRLRDNPAALLRGTVPREREIPGTASR